MCLDETKLEDCYPNLHFKIDGFQYPLFRRYRNRHRGGKRVCKKEGIFNKRLSNYESKTSETFCFEVKISKKIGCILFAYRPPQNFNQTLFFEEIANSLNKMTNKYDNVLLTGDPHFFA